MQVYVASGKAYLLDHLILKEIFQSKQFYFISFVFVMMMALNKPLLFGLEVPSYFRLIYWVLCVATFISFWYWQFRVLAGLKFIRRRLPWVPTVLLHVLPLLATILFSSLFVHFLKNNGDPYVYPHLVHFLRYWLMITVFELLFVLWFDFGLLSVTEVTNSDDDDDANDESPSNSKTTKLVIGKETISVRDIRYFKSAEHYIEFSLENGSKLLRASFLDVTKRLDDDAGVQTHRCYWVARDSLDKLVRHNGSNFLLLTNGEEIPVSRQRKKAVEAWLDDFHLGKKDPA